MGRKHRIESNDGFYHVINRGNYRKHIFGKEGAKKSFTHTLYEAVEKSQWELLSYVIMSNHYHPLIHTPSGNLSSGMQWLQSTFSNRFSRYRKICGRLFQGRYKSLIVELGEAVGKVAACMKEKTAAPNQWIADNLKMGHPATMSSAVSAYRNNHRRSRKA